MSLAESPHPPRPQVEFTLPLGYVERDGTLHRQRVMRLAMAPGEIHALHDDRVIGNQA